MFRGGDGIVDMLYLPPNSGPAGFYVLRVYEASSLATDNVWMLGMSDAKPSPIYVRSYHNKYCLDWTLAENFFVHIFVSWRVDIAAVGAGPEFDLREEVGILLIPQYFLRSSHCLVVIYSWHVFNY